MYERKYGLVMEIQADWIVVPLGDVIYFTFIMRWVRKVS